MEDAKSLSALGMPGSTNINDLIYVIRGAQVMLDRDLAALFQVETKRINEAVNRNQARFPEEFCFRLSMEERESLRSQIATSREMATHGGTRYPPRAFTEQGIAMLSAILRSPIAVEASVRIMKAFVEMRRFFVHNSNLLERIRSVELKQLLDQKHNDEKFDRLFDCIDNRCDSSQKIFFDGQIFDAFSLLAELIAEAKAKITLIDGYVNTRTLDLLTKKGQEVDAAIYTKDQGLLTPTEIQAFNAQYPRLSVHYTDVFHDRFLLIDDRCGYHIGASLKDAGKRCFAISRIEDQMLLDGIRERL